MRVYMHAAWLCLLRFFCVCNYVCVRDSQNMAGNFKIHAAIACVCMRVFMVNMNIKCDHQKCRVISRSKSLLSGYVCSRVRARVVFVFDFLACVCVCAWFFVCALARARVYVCMRVCMYD